MQNANNNAPIIKQRDYKINIKADVGKRREITGESATFEKAGFNCGVCDLSFFDSAAYLEHINSNAHQVRLGFSTKIEISTLDKVRARIDYHRRKKLGLPPVDDDDEKQNELVVENDDAIPDFLKDSNDNDNNKDAEHDNKKLKTNESENENDADDNNDHDDNDNGGNDDIAKIMGFSSFGSSKQKQQQTKNSNNKKKK